MKNIKKFVISGVVAIIVCGVSFTYASQVQTIPAKTMQASQAAQAVQNIQNNSSNNQARTYIEVNPLTMVNNPAGYFNKYVQVKGKFDKFSTLGLDYPAAMRSSEKYISFLIQRPDVTDHDVPLSELKIFLTRAEAEKHIDLNSGDIIEFSGKVFSTALGDVWMDVDKFTVISTTKKDTDKKTE